MGLVNMDEEIVRVLGHFDLVANDGVEHGSEELPDALEDPACEGLARRGRLETDVDAPRSCEEGALAGKGAKRDERAHHCG